MKRQRTFTHFIYKGSDLGTFGTFNDSVDFNKLKENFGDLENFDSIHLKNDSELNLAREFSIIKIL